MRTSNTRSARHLSGAAAAVLALVLAPGATASSRPVQLSFTKDCPVLTCTGSLLSPAGKPVTFGKLCEALGLVHPLFGSAQALRVDVGRVEQGAVEKPLFVKHDRERIGLLSRGASRNPYF